MSRSVTVVLEGHQALGRRGAGGEELYALQLSITGGVPAPYRLLVGDSVPPAALPLVFRGSKLHAELGDDPNTLVVDWAAGAAS